MFRAAAYALLLAAATPALAEPRQLPCGIGAHGKITHVTGLRVEARLDERDPRDIRYEYRAVLRNPHGWAAHVMPSIELAGVRPAPMAVSVVPARGVAEVLLGWVPVSDPIRRGAPPAPEEVQRRFVLEVCHIDQSRLVVARRA